MPLFLDPSECTMLSDMSSASTVLHPSLSTHHIVKRKIERVTGVMQISTQMCVNSCVAYTGPFKDLGNVVIKTISSPLSKKNIKTKRELKTETRNDPTMTHIHT